MSPVLEQPARARLITEDPHSKAISVALRYDEADPLAVRIVFPAGISLDGTEVVWAFARDLLVTGMREPVGDGDVQVWPCGRVQTVVEFHAAEGVAVVAFDSAPLRRFLDASYAMVPAGEERHDIEAERGLFDVG